MERKGFSQPPTQMHTSTIIFINSKSKQISSLALSNKHDLIRYSIPRAQQNFFIFFKFSITIMSLCSVCYKELTALCDSSVHRGSFQTLLLPWNTEQITRAGSSAAPCALGGTAIVSSRSWSHQGQGPAPEAGKPPEPKQNQ